MTTVSEQVQYESGLRMRYAVLAFVAAIAIVISQLLELSGTHAPVNELTVGLIYANHRATQNLFGAAFDAIGLVCVAFVLSWLHKISRARKPDIQPIVRWLAFIGGILAGVMAIIYTIVVMSRAHEFVTTGNQGYPEANRLTTGGLISVLPLLLQLGLLMLTIGAIWTTLNVMKVGLLPRPVGYTGIIAGALFLFPIGALVPLIQGLWLAAVAVLLAGRWPQGDPPAWEAGEAVPWQISEAQQRAIDDRKARRDQRGQRGQRRGRVSDQDVLAAVDSSAEDKSVAENPSSASGAPKRKRKRRS